MEASKEYFEILDGLCFVSEYFLNNLFKIFFFRILIVSFQNMS